MEFIPTGDVVTELRNAREYAQKYLARVGKWPRTRLQRGALMHRRELFRLLSAGAVLRCSHGNCPCFCNKRNLRYTPFAPLSRIRTTPLGDDRPDYPCDRHARRKSGARE